MNINQETTNNHKPINRRSPSYLLRIILLVMKLETHKRI